MVLIAMTMATILAVTFLSSQGPTAAIGQNIAHHASARLVAESGLTAAIEYIRNSEDWRTQQVDGVWLASQDFGGGSFRIMFEDDDGDLTNNTTDPVTVTVVGTFKGVTHRVMARITPGVQTGPVAGLLAQHYHSAWYDTYPIDNLNSIDKIDWGRTPEYTEVVANINRSSTNGSFYNGGPSDYFGVRYTGYVTVPSGGNWTFYTTSDDGSDLWINGTRVVNNDGLHSMQERSGSITLTAGTHSFVVHFFERTGGAGVQVRWQGPGVGKQIIPAEAFTHDGAAAAEEEAEGVVPQLLALYEFNEIKIVPTLVGHWRLDETTSGGGGVASNNTVELKNNARIDSYDSAAGEYGGGNVTAEATVATNHTGNNRIKLANNSQIHGSVYTGVGSNPTNVVNVGNNATLTGTKTALSAAMPVPSSITWPVGMPANEGDYSINNTQTFNSDRHFDKLELKNNGKLYISGHVRILCEEEFTVDNNAEVILNPGATLMVYVNDKVEFKNNAKVNNDSTRAGDFRLLILDNKKLTIDNNAKVAARVETEGEVELKNNGELFGSMTAHGVVTLDNNAKIHVDTDLPSVTGIKPPLVDSARGNDGTYTVGGTLGQGGAIASSGTSVRFDGSDDYAVIPHHDDYLLDAGSLSLWFRTEDKFKNQSIFSKDHLNLGTGGHLTVIIEAGQVKTRLQSTSETWPLTAAAAIESNTWHHMVFTWGPNKMRLYLDGTEIGDPYNYIGGTGATSGGAGNFEPIVLGADARHSSVGLPTPVSDFFKGRIDDVRIYDQALDLNQVQNLAGGSDPGPSSFPGYIVEDTSGFGDPLNMTVQDTAAIAWIDGGGLTITAPTSVISDAPATKLHTALTATDQMALELRVTPASLGQTGPARIVSYAASLDSRSFMLGQHNTEFHARVRTSDTGHNGTPDIESPGGLTLAPHHLVLSYDGTNVTLYRDGNLVQTVARTGTLDWDSSFKLFFGAEADGSRNWLGTLNRVAVYDRGLDAGQVENLYNDLPPGAAGGSGVGAFNAVWVEQP